MLEKFLAYLRLKMLRVENNDAIRKSECYRWQNSLAQRVIARNRFHSQNEKQEDCSCSSQQVNNDVSQRSSEFLIQHFRYIANILKIFESLTKFKI